MLLTPSGIVTLVRFMRLMKALSPMLFTAVPSISDGMTAAVTVSSQPLISPVAVLK